MGIDDVVADLEVADRCLDLEIGVDRLVRVYCLSYFGNIGLLCKDGGPFWPPSS
jgi:hypothetical protein